MKLEHELQSLLVCKVEMVLDRQFRVISIDDRVVALLQIFPAKLSAPLTSMITQDTRTGIFWCNTEQKQMRQLHCVDRTRPALH